MGQSDEQLLVGRAEAGGLIVIYDDGAQHPVLDEERRRHLAVGMITHGAIAGFVRHDRHQQRLSVEGAPAGQTLTDIEGQLMRG